jgi:tRNA (guanine-N7-)-methyltransferase
MHALWRFVFGNSHPVEVEIGPGTGTFLLAAAARAPHVNFFAIEHSRSRAAQLAAALEARGLGNARVLAADAACVVSTLLPAAAVAAYHIYFPDPWWKRRHHRRRLFTPTFAAALQQTLAPGGRIYVATDVAEVLALAIDALAKCAELTCDGATPPPGRGTTAFERKGLARGASIREAIFVKRSLAQRGHASSAAPITPAESPSWCRRIGVRSSSLKT